MELKNIDCVSFDVYDTLLFRTVYCPHDIPKMMMEFNMLNFQWDIVRNSIGGSTIDEIYDKIQYHYKIPQDICNELKKLEISLEKKCCVRNEAMYALYKKCKDLGVKVVATSDMHLSNETISEILTNLGYEFDHVFVSSDGNGSKVDGKIFLHISKVLQIPSSKILHIGDNFKADCVHSRLCLMPSIHYEAPHLSRNKFQEELFYTHGYTTAYSVFMALNVCKSFPNMWYKLGYRYLGCMAVSFINYLVERLQNKDIDMVYFMVRDGYLYKLVWDILAKHMDLPKAEMLFFSRKMFNTNDIEPAKKYLSPRMKGRVVIVDVGWHATTQKFIQEHFPDVVVEGHYIGVHFSAPDNAYGYLYNKTHLAAIEWWETFSVFVYPTGSISEATIVGDEVEFKFDPPKHSQEDQQQVIQGIQDFAEHFYRASCGRLLQFQPREIDFLMSRLIYKPTPEEATLLSQIYYEHLVQFYNKNLGFHTNTQVSMPLSERFEAYRVNLKEYDEINKNLPPLCQ